MARAIKERFVSLRAKRQEQEFQISGKCLKTKLPRRLTLNSSVLTQSALKYADRVESIILTLFEKTSAELVGDVLDSGVWLSGGSALIDGLTEELSRKLKLQVRLAQAPLLSVIQGSGQVISNPELLRMCRVIHRFTPSVGLNLTR